MDVICNRRQQKKKTKEKTRATLSRYRPFWPTLSYLEKQWKKKEKKNEPHKIALIIDRRDDPFTFDLDLFSVSCFYFIHIFYFIKTDYLHSTQYSMILWVKLI